MRARRWSMIAAPLALACGADGGRIPTHAPLPSAGALVSASIASSAPSAASAPTARADAGVGAVPARAILEGDVVLESTAGKKVLISAGKNLPAGPVPIVTAMHGMCETGPGICALLAPVLDGRGVAVCPTGNGECANKDIPKGTNDWILGTSKTTIRDALDAAEARLGQSDDRTRGDVLLGNSRGAFAAVSIVSALVDGPWTGLVLVSASVEPDPKLIVRGGIQRVLLATEDFDVTAENMRKATARLCKAGVPARFVSLGKMGHGIHPEGALVLRDNMDWVMSRAPTDECVKRSAP
jgi:acetyl esterase/lipase